jgi:hypothetical protein
MCPYLTKTMQRVASYFISTSQHLLLLRSMLEMQRSWACTHNEDMSALNPTSL